MKHLQQEEHLDQFLYHQEYAAVLQDYDLL